MWYCDAWSAYLASLVSVGSAWRCSHSRARTGEERLLAWHSALLKNEAGTVVGAVGSGEDITEQRRAEEALRDGVAKLRLITDSVPVLIAQVDKDYRYRFNNAAYEEFFGTSREELSGTLVTDLIGEHAFAQAEPYMVRALAGQTVEHEFLVQDQRGRVRDLARQYVPNRDESGEVVGFYALSADHTERKQLERALRQSQKMEAVGLLVSGISHDINNLLMGIGGCANLALSRLDEDSPARILLDEIRSAATSGANISRQLLDLSQQTGGDVAEVPLDVLVANSESMLRRLSGAEVGLHVDLSADREQARVGRGQLEQILMNLVVNARDACSEGGAIDVETRVVDLTVETARRYGLEPGRFLTLSVRDTGTGMDEATVERIFEPFFTTKKAGKGTGLGLSTVYGIVKQCGGYLDVQSRLGEGSNFTVYLPVNEIQSQPARNGERDGGRGSETVLVVEDDRLVQLTVREYLASSGYRVLEARDGDEAVQLAREHLEPLPLVISDMVLPGMSGSKVVLAVQQIHPEAKVIYMSAHSAQMLAEAGHVRHGTQTLQKPFGELELLARVRDVLGSPPDPDSAATATEL